MRHSCRFVKNKYRTNSQNKNQILEIPDYVYRYLLTDGAGSLVETQDAEMYVQELKIKGFLNSSRLQISEHPVTEYYSSLLENNLGQISFGILWRRTIVGF